MKKILSFLLISLLILIYFPVEATADATELYVAVDGSDDAEGTVNAPLASLVGARDRIRELRQVYGLPTGGYTVYIREGVYEQEESFTLTAEDSGVAGAPITYRAYPNEMPIFVGSSGLAKANFKNVTDSAVLSRISDAGAKKEVLEYTLSDSLLEKLGETPYLGETINEYALGLSMGELFVDGEPMTIAKWPNEGFARTKEEADGASSFSFTTTSPRAALWDTDDARMVGFFGPNWHAYSIKIGSVNNKKITSAHPMPFSITKYASQTPRRYFVYNVLEELDVPGEYYIDREAKRLYFYPPQDWEDKRISLSLTENELVRLHGTSYITLSGLQFGETREKAVAIRGGMRNLVTNCMFIGTGKAMAVLVESGTHNGVQNCYFKNVDGGISLYGGDKDMLSKGENFAINNTIEDFSRITYTYRAAINLYGVGQKAMHNTIKNAPHLAISLAGIEGLVAYNEISDVVKLTEDSGVIYSGSSWVTRGNVITNNYIHDIKSEEYTGYPISAVYLDEHQSGTLVHGNLFENISGRGVMIHKGRDNCVEDNIFQRVDVPLIIADNANGQVFGVGDAIYDELESVCQNEAWQQNYSELLELLADSNPGASYGNIFRNNYLINSGTIQFSNVTVLEQTKANTSIQGNATSIQDIPLNGISSPFFSVLLKHTVQNKILDFDDINSTQIGSYNSLLNSKLEKSILMQVGNNKALVDGELVVCENAPHIIDEVPYIPVSSFVDIYNATMEWNAEETECTVICLGRKINLKVGATSLGVCCRNEEMTKAAIVSDGVLMIPAEALEIIFHRFVQYDEHAGAIQISKADENIIDKTSEDYFFRAAVEKLY